MRIAFTKMQGLGNDFVLIDDMSGVLALEPAQARRLADRRFGVGCDQVLVAEPAPGAPAAGGGRPVIGMRIFNADGTEAGQCGNGVRCFALFARRRGLVRDGSFTVDTSGGAVRVEVESEGASGGRVSVDMGRPRLEPREIPFVAEARAPSYALSVGPETIRISAVSVGNPHAVLVVDDVAAAPVGRLGPRVQALGAFPQGVNVGFMQVLDPHRIRLRVYERGVGETLACGTGACAAVVAGRIRGLLEAEVEVELRGGRLEIGWTGEGESVRMTGPATEVFEGTIDL